MCSVWGGSKTLNISLLVDHIPTVAPTNSTISQSPGYPPSLSCEVTAVPVPAVSWYRLGLSKDPAMIKSHGDTSILIADYKDGRMVSSLVLDNVTQQDYGQYSCNATNTHGQVGKLNNINHTTIAGLGHCPADVLSLPSPAST